MRILSRTVYKDSVSSIKAFGAAMRGVRQPRSASVNLKKVRPPNLMRRSDTGPVTYSLSPDFIRTFAVSGMPFLTFYEFNDLVGWYRDTYFAPDHVDGYNQAAGKVYTVWTHDATSAYRRHILFDALKNDIKLSFEIPTLDAAAWFPLRIKLYDQDGMYFQHDQKLVVERIMDSGSQITSWKKLPDLRISLARIHQRTAFAR